MLSFSSLPVRQMPEALLKTELPPRHAMLSSSASFSAHAAFFAFSALRACRHAAAAPPLPLPRDAAASPLSFLQFSITAKALQ